MLQIGDLERQFVIDTRFLNPGYLYPLLEDKLIVGQNLKFDFKQLKHHYN